MPKDLRTDPAPVADERPVVSPRGHEAGFSLRYENWLREAKVPILVLNATTLNTGHNWQFTASWMGEPPVASTDQRRREPPPAAGLLPRRAGRSTASRRSAQAPSAARPACPAPVPADHARRRLYDDVDVELVDGGVHDNQGIASLLEQDCNVILVSDASGQMRDADRPEARPARRRQALQLAC